MPIIVKYNNDFQFRRQVAFNRMYHSANVKRRVAIELALMAAFAAAAVIVWVSEATFSYSTYVFYALALVAVVLLARFVRALMVRRRIKPNDDPGRAAREFIFEEDGFSFGPTNEAGDMLKTRWGDIDRIYVTERVIYFMCMSRKHWAAVDRKLLVSGEWDELIKLVSGKVPKFKIYGLGLK